MTTELSTGPSLRDALLARVGGDAALATAMVSLFLEECPRLLADVRNAVGAQDATALKFAAHTMCGSVSNFTAPPAVEAAARLELIGRSGDLQAAGDALRRLEMELDRLLPALREMLA